MKASLCVGEYCENAYNVEGLDIRVYSMEELCYCLKENAFLLDLSIMNDKLVDWIGEECKVWELAKQLYPMVHTKSFPFATFVKSTNFMSKRISGLSQPYCSIASCHVIRGNAGISIPLISLKRWRIISSKIPSTSSRSTNDISQSI